MSVPKQILVPSYFERFSCIGGDCEDHCCKEWDIRIDRKTYQKYRSIKAPAFVDSFSQRIKRVRGEMASDVNYAQFVMDDKGCCKFLTDDGLCELQRDHGPSYLCITCSTYPRRQLQQVVDGIFETSMFMTCPEVVRVALFPKEQITFQLNDAAEFINRYNLLKHIKLIPSTGPRQYAWQIREGCIDILQWNKTSFSNRLLAVGMMLSKLTELASQEAYHNIPGAVALYVEAVREGKYDDMLATFPENLGIQTGMGLVLTKTITEHANDPKRVNGPFRQFIATVAKEMGFESSGHLTFADIHNIVEERAAKIWPAFMAQRAHVIENFFVNYVFSTVFPFSFEELDMYHHFVLLAEQYALMRMLVCMTAGAEKGMSDQAMIQLIKALSTNLEHNQEARRILEFYQKAKLDSLAHVSYLLHG